MLNANPDIIIGILLYLTSILFGISLTDLFLNRIVKERLYRIGAGVVVGFILSTYIILLFEIVAMRFIDISVMLTSLIEIVISYTIIRRIGNSTSLSPGPLKAEFKQNRMRYLGIILLTLFFVLLQIAGVHQHGNGIWTSYNYGSDLLFHIGIGNSLIYSGFPPSYPYIYNTTNVFPFIGDFYTEILSYNGFGILGSTYMVNFLLWFSLICMLMLFFDRIGKNPKASFFAVVLFIFFSLGLNFLILTGFNLSLPGLTHFSVDQISNRGLLAILSSLYYNFSDPFVNNLIIQHDYLFGLPFVLLILTFVFYSFVDAPESTIIRKRYLISAVFVGILFGLLPLVDPFGFIFAFVFSLTLFVITLSGSALRNLRNRRNRRPTGVTTKRLAASWLAFGISAALVSLPSIIYISSQNKISNFYGYMLDSNLWYHTGISIIGIFYSHIAFWINSIGLLFVLGIIGLVYLGRKGIIAFIPALIIFILINIFRFQPQFGDSNKLTTFFSLFLALSTALLLYRLFTARGGKSGILLKFLSGILFFLVVCGGIGGTYYVFTTSSHTYTGLEASATSWLINNTNSNDIFQSNCFNHTYDFVTTTAGRKSVLDMYIYAYSDGIMPNNFDATAVYDQFYSFFSSPTPSCSLVDEYNVSYIVLENITKIGTQYNCAPANFSAFDNSSNFTNIYNAEGPQSEHIAIYKSRC